jgi:hypothetical protein
LLAKWQQKLMCLVNTMEYYPASPVGDTVAAQLRSFLATQYPIAAPWETAHDELIKGLLSPSPSPRTIPIVGAGAPGVVATPSKISSRLASVVQRAAAAAAEAAGAINIAEQTAAAAIPVATPAAPQVTPTTTMTTTTTTTVFQTAASSPILPIASPSPSPGRRTAYRRAGL